MYEILILTKPAGPILPAVTLVRSGIVTFFRGELWVQGPNWNEVFDWNKDVYIHAYLNIRKSDGEREIQKKSKREG